LGEQKIAVPAPRRATTALGEVEYIDQGQGPALLSIHGLTGGCDQSWLFARALAPDISARRVIAVSRPGYLGTALDLVDAQQQGDLLAALLQTLGVSHATVAATSAGGPSALHLAARHARFCDRLILVSAATRDLPEAPEAAERIRMMKLMVGNPAAIEWVRQKTLADPRQALSRTIPDTALCERTLADPEANALLTAFLATTMDRLGQRLPGSINDMEQIVSLAPAPFAEINAPTLIVHSQDDPVVPFSHALAAAAGIVPAELMALPIGEHACVFTHLHAIRAKAAAYLAA
jgi:pimeloyl-ACP methyl ester carboxylesterase